ncbi:hypothetical protein CHS0354_012327 [Potamilus streckersoni]|uniref:Uncharacterized protein n=1 Tax=Potamilus streckersoni TaxID=2493646 RepID=A0AAE0SK64_9BIVA|nr:hypothetical protein CHS0354_012327 [Potamilus streckersoni]
MLVCSNIHIGIYKNRDDFTGLHRATIAARINVCRDGATITDQVSVDGGGATITAQISDDGGGVTITDQVSVDGGGGYSLQC